MQSLYEKLPVYKSALDLAVYFEKIICHFEKRHKYTIGADLKNLSRRILVLVAKANTKESRKDCLIEALDKLEELKITIRLCREIKGFPTSRSILFAAKKPKLREIFAADFRDRIVHHILVDYLEKIWEPIFIYDSYACRENKGTHKAIKRLQSFARKITKNGNIRVYYLQLDIKDFFTSIDKDILFSLISKKIESPDILWLAEIVLFWDCTASYIEKGRHSILSQIPFNKSLFGKDNKKGLPIGNLTSQFFANVYLNELDQYVKHTLKCKYYLRYVDDFVILGTDKAELLNIQNQIEKFLLKHLQLKLHPKRRKLQPISNGIDFLGYIVRPKYILVRRRVINNFKKKIRQFQAKNTENFKSTIASYMGHFKHAQAFLLKRSLIGKIGN